MRHLKKDNTMINNIFNENLIKKTSTAIVKYYNKHKLKKTILIGNNGNPDSDYTTSVIASVFLKNGIEIHSIGACTTPCLAYLTKKYNYPIGLMLSSFESNEAFKFVNNNSIIKNEIANLMSNSSQLRNNGFAKFKNNENLKQDYISYLKSFVKFDIPCIFASSNVGISEICKKLFTKQEKINLNQNMTDLKILSSLCIKKQKIGFYFEQNGEIVNIVDTNGDIIGNDKILNICSHCNLKKEDNSFTLKQFKNNNDGILISIILTNTIKLTKKSLKELFKDNKA